MNREHLKAFLWLRWRLRVNQIKRAGMLNAVLTAILAGFGVVASVGLFIAGLVVGAVLMPELTPAIRLYIWDGLVLQLLFFWMIGLMAQLQRAEAVSLDRILQLPVSASGAYLVNYLSSFFSVSLILFIPGMCGLVLGQLYSAGPAMLLAFPLLAAFVLALTALTYQFQGWLAAQMGNPRKQRTVVVLMTFGFILVTQLPGLLNLARMRQEVTGSQSLDQVKRYEEITRQLKAGEITPEESTRRTLAVPKEQEAEAAQQRAEMWVKVEQTTRIVNIAFPPGWLPLGVAELSEGHVLPALLGALGLGLIGAGSLWRGYRATVRMYTDGGTGTTRRQTVVPIGRAARKLLMVEWRLPWVSDAVSGVAMAGLRSLLRSPEAKMMLITPVIFGVMFGGVAISIPSAPPGWAGPLISIAAVTMILATSMQLGANQFGYDRAGFRSFVLSPTPRRDILLGKNLSMAPVVLGLGTLAAVVVAIFCRLRLDHFLATLIQMVAMYLPYCLLANVSSIYAPYLHPSGSLKGARPSLKVILTQFLLMVAFPPLVGLPGIFPAVANALVAEVGEVRWLPVSLVLSLGCLAVSVWAYRRLLPWQGRLLAQREQAILEVVTGRSE